MIKFVPSLGIDIFNYNHRIGREKDFSLFAVEAPCLYPRSLFRYFISYSDDFNSVELKFYEILFMRFTRKDTRFLNDSCEEDEEHHRPERFEGSFNDYKILKIIPVLYQGWECDDMMMVVEHKKTKERYFIESNHGTYLIHKNEKVLLKKIKEYENAKALTQEALDIFNNEGE